MGGLSSMFNTHDIKITTEDKNEIKDIDDHDKPVDPVDQKKQDEKDKKKTIIKTEFGIEKIAVPVINKPFIVNVDEKNNKIYAYLFGECECSDDYGYFNSILDAIDEKVEVKLYIDSPGGDVATALYMAQAIRNTKAKVTAIAFGKVMSAATFLFDVCKNKVINDGSLFMFHDFSTGMYGKGSLIKEYIDITIKALKENENSLLSPNNKRIKQYLSPDELEKFTNSFDVYVPGIIIKERLNAGVEYV